MKTDQFAAMGLAAMLPGLQHAVEILQRQLDDYRTALAELQQMDSNGLAPPVPKKLGRPNKFNSWVNLSPEEREARSRNLSDAQRRVRGLPPKKRDTNGQARLSTGWPADPEERRKEMLRRRSKWSKESVARQKAGAAAHWDKSTTNGEAQRKHWAGLTPAQRKKRGAAAAEGRRKAQAAHEATAQ